MDLPSLQNILTGLPIGPIRYYDRIGSTNLEAANWAEQGAPDMALVVADEQTAGRGRQARRWLTIPKASLAFSMVLKPSTSDTNHNNIELFTETEIIARMTALGAVAVSKALEKKYNLISQIKWPNDVMLDGCKVAGVLAEIHWQANLPQTVILGIGVNVNPESVPVGIDLIYPATCIQSVLGKPISRLDLLRAILEQIIEWRNRVKRPEFLKVWEEQLAFRGQWVNIFIEAGSENQEVHRGLVLGLDNLGGLRLRDLIGRDFTLHMGEIRMRPLEDR
jgi:BirA family biotin operon repressor/biotin-[acetyl-CoA-carboxylase] ligase